jgi:hypothetical protein
MSGFDGINELSVVNRAAGTLIDQGHYPSEAHEVLRRQAMEAGVEPQSTQPGCWDAEHLCDADHSGLAARTGLLGAEGRLTSPDAE